MSADYDDTLPLPVQVEQELLNHAPDSTTASAWLHAFDIDVRPIVEHVGCFAMIDSVTIWNPDEGIHKFSIYGPKHIGPKFPSSFALPIVEAETFVDLLLIDCMSFDFTTICGRAKWLGRDQIGRQDLLRLHRHPMDWLAAGCRGVCHIEPISRRALKDLLQVRKIICNDIHTALDAWDWSSGDDDGAGGRWVIDDEPENIVAYFDKIADLRVISALQETDLWPRKTWPEISMTKSSRLLNATDS